MDGILLINKPAHITSRDVVNKVSRLLNTKKIGHTGTLDPMATGVLVLCIGRCTKIADLITSYDKEYIAEITLGIETDTLDIEGNVLREELVRDVTIDEINEVLNSFLGFSKQEVPIYSAIKVNGKKLYEYARKNIEVELPIKDINISSIELISDIRRVDTRLVFKFRCVVSKGTYIRSLIRDIGRKLNIPACMSSLERTRQGSYTIENCYTIEDIENNKYKLLSIKEALKDYSNVVVDRELESKIMNGSILDRFFNGEEVLITNAVGEAIAIYQTYSKDKTKVKPFKML